MPRYHLINGERVQFTAEEETARDAEEKAWADSSKERKLKQIKELRLDKLKETDWYSNSDVTMPDNIKTWRQQLRDLPQTYTTEEQYDELLEMQGDFPNQTYKHTIWSKP
tara:strand:- start:1267 stop:1596 length:330 start_codon:yes stop_codon:yes gene_type:complete